MSVLVIADVVSGEIALDATAKAVTGASALGKVTVLCAGVANADAVAALTGVEKVLLVDDAIYGQGLAENMASLIVSLAGDFDNIVAPATSSAKNIMPRVAALLDVMVLSDVTEIVDATTFKRPIYAGNAIQTVQSLDAIRVMTLRTSHLEPAATGCTAAVEALCAAASPDLSSFIEDKVVANDRPDLTSAQVVVSGGRGVGSEADFAMIATLADKLGAAVGASRAAVDSGFAANDLQVGQTGKVVAPNLYIAIGISGAIQHLAGMKDSKIIVAINKDEDAPIFQVADYGLVADLFEAVPQLIETV